jgi:hypothetical protein
LLHKEKSKDDVLEAITIVQSIIKSDKPLYQYALIAHAILSGTFKDDFIDMMMEQEPHAQEFKTCEKVLLDYQSGVKTDNDLLETLYTQLITLAFYQADGNKALVLEAMENIEAIQEKLNQEGTLKYKSTITAMK